MRTFTEKGLNFKVSTHVHIKELDCKCKDKTCWYTVYNSMLITLFEEFRTRVGEPLVITSGFRCQKHND